MSLNTPDATTGVTGVGSGADESTGTLTVSGGVLLEEILDVFHSTPVAFLIKSIGSTLYFTIRS